jgi:hypothetical protein
VARSRDKTTLKPRRFGFENFLQFRAKFRGNTFFPASLRIRVAAAARHYPVFFIFLNASARISIIIYQL